MNQKINAIKLDNKDNVVVALSNLSAGELLFIQGEKKNIALKENIPSGHKIAIHAIKKGEKIMKYGECMGMSLEDIPIGFHVHVNNVRGLNMEER
ncbi:UxaA family hydrolase [Salibacterium aidingense]|uniref:UxaA family hydrolase n=1 Tax=Salibacterium aidingense TaxID=384933 RepID=UPI000406CDB0|nr:UxaA family hydrolase [Salibacterium aidingense]